MLGCPRCKRRPQDGHDSWCDGSPETFDNPGPAPVTVRYVAPSYAPPAPKPRPDFAKLAAEQAAKKQAAAAEKLAAKLKTQAAKAAKAAKAKPKPKSVPSRVSVEPKQVQAHPACGHCRGPIIGRHKAARYCSQTCSNAASFQRLKARRAGPPRMIPCGHCGKSFTAKKATNKFCSRQCYRRAWTDAEVARRREQMGQALACRCQQCGKPMEAQRVTRQFCSDACQQRHWRITNGKGPKPRDCQTCGGEYMPDSNVQKHCQPCRKAINRGYQRAYAAKLKEVTA